MQMLPGGKLWRLTNHLPTPYLLFAGIHMLVPKYKSPWWLGVLNVGGCCIFDYPLPTSKHIMCQFLPI